MIADRQKQIFDAITMMRGLQPKILPFATCWINSGSSALSCLPIWTMQTHPRQGLRVQWRLRK
jgi:hypothetical protein